MEPTAIPEGGPPGSPGDQGRLTARRVLMAFLVTFACARLVVYLIMARKVPDLFLHLGGTHVHHLNYGIFLLAAVGGYLLFKPGANPRLVGVLYGAGMALTFDEFGMWLHLGGSYWQRASWDAVAVIAAGLALFAYGPAIGQYRPRHWATAASLLALGVMFFYFLTVSLRHAGRAMLPRLEHIEKQGPQ